MDSQSSTYSYANQGAIGSGDADYNPNSSGGNSPEVISQQDQQTILQAAGIIKTLSKLSYKCFDQCVQKVFVAVALYFFIFFLCCVLIILILP